MIPTTRTRRPRLETVQRRLDRWRQTRPQMWIVVAIEAQDFRKGIDGARVQQLKNDVAFHKSRATGDQCAHTTSRLVCAVFCPLVGRSAFADSMSTDVGPIFQQLTGAGEPPSTTASGPRRADGSFPAEC